MDHASFGRGKRTLQAGGYYTENGRDVDDTPVFLFQYGAGRRPADEKRSGQIDLYDSVPLFQREFVNVNSMLGRVYTGIVNQDVEPAKLLHYLRQRRLDALFI